MLAIIDYGVGNLFSLTASLNKIGAEVKVTGKAAEIRKADRIILPGVGAFEDAIGKLKSSGLDKVLLERADDGVPVLGICLGMQLLFDESHEYGRFDGLGMIKGKVVSMEEELKTMNISGLKVPHMGWNKLNIKRDEAIFRHIKPDSYVYYVHSFYGADCDESIIAASEYGVIVPGVVRQKNVYGMQFHPEKSGETGLGLLKGFMDLRSAAEKPGWGC